MGKAPCNGDIIQTRKQYVPSGKILKHINFNLMVVVGLVVLLRKTRNNILVWELLEWGSQSRSISSCHWKKKKKKTLKRGCVIVLWCMDCLSYWIPSQFKKKKDFSVSKTLDYLAYIFYLTWPKQFKMLTAWLILWICLSLNPLYSHAQWKTR